MLSVDDLNKSGKLFPEYDPEEHLRAINALRISLQAIMREHDAAIEAAKTSGFFADEMHAAVYAEAAHSQAMVGALAPFIEGMLHHEIGFIQYLYAGQRPDPKHHPRRSSMTDDEGFWKPSIYLDRNSETKDNIQDGYVQLLTALDLLDRMPTNFKEVTGALFTYRNHALHGGYEWLEPKRANFKRLVDVQGWAGWFSFSTIDGHPWTVSMTETFIDECLRVATEMVQAFDNIRDDLLQRIFPPQPLGEIWRRMLGEA